jgi:hypothetical protein
MSDFLNQAGQIAGALRFALKSAITEVGAVEALALRPLSATAAQLEADLLALLAAQERDKPRQVGFMYADDAAQLPVVGRAFVYLERQAFTVSQDPGCTPVFTRENAS